MSEVICNNECYIDKYNNIVISEWWKSGVFIVRREHLPDNHPESMFQCIKRLGGNPYRLLERVMPTDSTDTFVCPKMLM